MTTNRTQAIVLRRTNYGEADRVLQLLTPEGKISVMAKGVRREKSRLASGIELFAICEVVVTKGKGDLNVLTSARLVHFFRHIIEDYDRMQFGYLAIKLISKASEDIDSPDWYDVLAETLAALDARSVDIRLTQIWFFLRYAYLTGYELSLENDIDGNKLTKEFSYMYDIPERGLKKKENGEIKSDHIKLLRLISTKQIKTLNQIGGISDLLSVCLFIAQNHASI